MARSAQIIIFDVGGTLINLDFDLIAEIMGDRSAGIRLASTQGELRKRMNTLFRVGGVETEQTDTFKYMITTMVELAGLDVTSEGIGRVCEQNQTKTVWREPNQDALEWPKRLREAGHRVAVVSNSDGTVRELLDDHGYSGQFEVVIDSGIVGVAKPDPEIFRIALAELGASAEEGIYIGDIPAIDETAALAAGLKFVLYDPCDVHSADVREETRRIVSFSELLSVIG